jgi:DNA-binding protein HU-beta
MKKSELIDQVAERAQTSKAAAARAVDAIFDASSGAIAEAVRAGKQVAIPGFGKFKPQARSARKGRNPQTGAEIDIPERTVVSFTPGKGLRESVDTKSGSGKTARGTKPKASGRTGTGRGGAKGGGRGRSTGK